MSWVPAQQVLEAVEWQRKVLAEQQARMAAAAQQHKAERHKVEAEGVQAAQDLGRAVLPALDAAHIERAARMVGLPGLPGEDLPGKLEARRAWLASRLRAILQDPRYANAELYRHPRTGTLVTALAEAREMRAPFIQVIEVCREHPRFERLLEVGFGTEGDKGAWWRYSHWVDRSAAKEIVARFPGKTTFAEVLQEYRRAAEAVATYDAEIAHLRAEIEAGEALAREYKTLYDEHHHLDAQGVEYARGRIVQHMLTADASLMSQRLLPVPDVRLLFLRTSGLAAKLVYLDGVQKAHLQQMDQEIGAQRAKLDGVEQRTRKRWAPMPADKYAKLVVDRRPSYEKRWQRYGKIYGQVNAFNRWDRGRNYRDLLWWDVMTRGRYDGSYIMEVDSFHRMHPGYTFDPELYHGHGPVSAQPADLDPLLPDAQDEAEAAALAAGDAAEPDTGADLSVVDAS